MLKATFVRRRGHRDRVYVIRADGTSTGWDFPSYGDGHPHDMCHLVVEDELKLTNGFWGLIDQGGEIEPINGQATLVQNGKPLVELSGRWGRPVGVGRPTRDCSATTQRRGDRRRDQRGQRPSDGPAPSWNSCALTSTPVVDHGYHLA